MNFLIMRLILIHLDFKVFEKIKKVFVSLLELKKTIFYQSFEKYIL